MGEVYSSDINFGLPLKSQLQSQLQSQSLPDNSNNTKEIITEPPSNANSKNTSEILEGGSEFKLEDDTQMNVERSSSPEIKVQEKQEKQKEQEEQEEQAVLEGGSAVALSEYKINYIVPDDEHLVDIDKIKSTVKRYIENYHSEAMKKYRQLFKIVYQKYSSKRYLIDNTDTEIIVSKSSVKTSIKDYKLGKRDIVYEISKPKYIFYNKDNNLILMKSIISNKRLELQIHYQSLVNKLDVQPEEKKQFEKERKQFIDLLERYYIYNLYDHQVNNISLEGKSNIIVQELHGFLKDNADKNFTLDGNVYTIDNSLVDKINTHNSNRLNIYNDLIVKLQSIKSNLSSSASVSSSTSVSSSASVSKDKTDKASSKKSEKDTQEKLNNEIKEYLKSSEENTKLNNEIKDAVRVQNTYVDYIIYKLPNN